ELRLGVRVEGDDLGAGRARLLERGADRRGVVGGDDEGVHALLRRGVDERHLGVGRGGVRSDLLNRHAELARRLLRARRRRLEVGVAQVLRQHGDDDVAAPAAGAGGEPQRQHHGRACRDHRCELHRPSPSVRRPAAGPPRAGAAARRRTLRPPATRGATTDTTSAVPITMLMTLTVTPSRRRALPSTPMSSTPPTTPCTAPRPPKIDTPPSSTAATTWSSRPVALSPRALP